jgi:tetratricopeptide (TPR) repeat protein
MQRTALRAAADAELGVTNTMRVPPLVPLLFLFAASSTMAIDIAPLWDFGKPDVSEQRFRQALERATGDDALILQTQIARTYGLRKDFEAARRILRQIESAVAGAGPEAKIRYHLELGRSFASATHTPEQMTPDDRARARQSFEAALNTARAAKMEALAVDSIHMFAFLDTAPADQLRWGQAALEIVQASSQPDAKRWEPSIRNNVGYALHQLGRYEEALTQFQQAVVLRERGTNSDATRVARWMVAWTLRSLKRVDEALEIQLRLEKENEAAGKPDPYVFEELEALYRDRGDVARAEHYANRKLSAGKQ